MGQGVYGKFLYLSLNFAVNLKLLKIIKAKERKKEKERLQSAIKKQITKNKNKKTVGLREVTKQSQNYILKNILVT